MLTLSKKLKESRKGIDNGDNEKNNGKIKSTIRDRLLTREIVDFESLTNSNCSIKFPDPNKLYEFKITIKPDEGIWKGGYFHFNVNIPLEYNIKPPQVRCMTPIWHPNISLEGGVCLSILRDHSLDGTGWNPTRSLKELVWGLQSLFTDLVDFEDPLNTDAADQYRKDKKRFIRSVESYLNRYALNP